MVIILVSRDTSFCDAITNITNIYHQYLLQNFKHSLLHKPKVRYCKVIFFAFCSNRLFSLTEDFICATIVLLLLEQVYVVLCPQVKSWTDSKDCHSVYLRK